MHTVQVSLTTPNFCEVPFVRWLLLPALWCKVHYKDKGSARKISLPGPVMSLVYGIDVRSHSLWPTAIKPHANLKCFLPSFASDSYFLAIKGRPKNRDQKRKKVVIEGAQLRSETATRKIKSALSLKILKIYLCILEYRLIQPTGNKPQSTVAWKGHWCFRGEGTTWRASCNFVFRVQNTQIWKHGHKGRSTFWNWDKEQEKIRKF